MHEDYWKYKYDNDIALIKLSNKITFVKNNVIAPICLPNNLLDSFVGANATLVGWGASYWGNYDSLCIFFLFY